MRKNWSKNNFFIFLSLLLLIVPMLSWASEKIQIDLFVSSTCPHCKKVEFFFDKEIYIIPWLTVNKYIINEDKKALENFAQRLNAIDKSDFFVPSMFFCGIRWVGFSNDSGQRTSIIQALEYCHKHMQHGKLSPVHQQVLEQMANVQLLASKITDTSSKNEYILFFLISTINFCSLFFCAAFLAALCLTDKKNQRVHIGLIFITTFMINLILQLNFLGIYFYILSWLRLPALIVSIFLLMYLYKPQSSIKKFYVPILFLFSFCLIIYQQSCTNNWALANAQKLISDFYLQSGYFIYQLVYYLLSCIPLALIFIIYNLLATTTWMKKKQLKFKKIAVYILWALVIFLIISPWSLANNCYSLLLIPLFILGYWRGDSVND